MLTVNSISPANEATQVSINPEILITFNTQLDSNSIDQSSAFLVELGVITVDIIIDESGIGTRDFVEIVDTTIVVDQNTITLTPQSPLKLGSTYSIILSDTIANVSAETLGTIYTSTFTTTNTTTTIVDQQSVNLTSNNANIGDGKFRLIDYSHSPNKVLKNFTENTELKFYFSLDVDSTGVDDKIIVKYEGLLDDTEEVIENPTITVSDNVITIKLGYFTTLPSGSIISIKFLGTLSSVTGKLLDSTEIHYVQQNTPFYVPVKLFRLRAGQLIFNIPDITLISLITFYSMEIDNFQCSNSTYSGSLPDSIKQAYAFYNTLYHLLCTTRQAPPDSIKKGLADFTLEISNKSQIDLYNRCVNDTKKALDTLNNYFITRCGSNKFIKSSRTLDYPDNIGRLYSEEYGEAAYKTRDLGFRRSRWITN